MRGICCNAKTLRRTRCCPAALAVALTGLFPAASQARPSDQPAVANRVVAPLAPREWSSHHKRGRSRRDSDGDGLSNWTERTKTKTNPYRRDTDRDGLSDRVEVRRTHTNPRRRDSDGDGLSDWTEVKRTHTNPRRADTDGDGVDDGTEVRAGSDPHNPASVPGLANELMGATTIGSESSPPAPPPPDTSPPETTVTAGPSALTNSANAEFKFNGEDPGGSGIASYECRLVGGVWAGCTSPRNYGGLSDGSHGFEVRAIDNAGNTDPTPASLAWTVDTSPPAVGIDSGPSGLTNDSTPTFTFRAGEAGASVECSIDTGAPDFGPCSGATSDTPGSPLSNGAYLFRVRATDQAGNRAVATRGFEVDTSAPDAPELTATVPPSPANDNDPAAIGSAPPDTTVRLYAGADCAGSPVATVGSPELEAGVAVAVPDDSTSSFSATATTTAENTSGCSEPISYVEDSTAPQTTIDSRPAALVKAIAAEFQFSGSDPGGSGVAGFQCRLDSTALGDWAGCSTGQEYTDLADGTHTFEVRAIDNAGNTDQSPAIFEWTVDTTPPAVGIDSGPTGLTNDSTPTFTFHAGETGASVVCSIDNGTPSFGPCSTATSYTPESPLADGSWTFRVRSTDEAGNQATATRSFEVDATEPDTRITAHPLAFAGSAEATFGFLGEDPGGSGVAGFQCRLDSAAPGAWASCSTGKQYTGLAEGSHSSEVRAIDKAGNVDGSPATYTWMVDTIAPATAIDLHPAALSASATAEFEFSASDAGGSGVSSYECRLDGGAWAPCTSPPTYGGLADGLHGFEVRAIDRAGNTDPSPASFEWTVDTRAPSTSIDSGPAALVNTGTAEFQFSGDDGSGSGVASYKCRRDGDGWSPCTSPVTFTELADGAHGFEVRAIDNAGNADASPSVSEWSVDTTAPDTSFGAHPAALVNATSAEFQFSGDDPGGSGVASAECRLDGGGWVACTSPQTYTDLSDGSHSFEVRAINNAGNTDQSPATFEWTVDTTPPAVGIDSGPRGLTNDSSPTFTFYSGEAGASVECSIDTGTPDFGPCSGATSDAPDVPLADGSWTFRVRATDAAGNQATAARSFEVDTSAPDAPELTATVPASPANDNEPEVVGSAPPDTTVRLYADDDCSGSPVATVESSELAAGVAVSVPDDSATSFGATATTAAENTSGCSEPLTYLEDSTAPETRIDSHPLSIAGTATAEFQFSGSDGSASGVAAYQCRLDSTEAVGWEACASPLSLTELSEGSHKLEVRAIDRAGNTDATPAISEWSVDTVAPTTAISEHPASLTASDQAEFKFSGDDGTGSGVASYECRRDGGAWASCTSPKTYTELADGSHTFEARAIDNAGNADQSPATFEWTVDTTPPAVGIDSGPAGLTNDATPTFTFHAGEAGASVECSLDKGTPAFGPCSTATSHTPESPLADGSWTFRVRSTDEAGNQATATRGFEVDASAPTTAIAEQPAALVNTDEAEFKFSGDDGTGSGVASYECRRDGGAWDPCTSPQTYSELADGPHKFEVRAIDNAGNTDATPAISEWSVDTKAPQPTIDSLSRELLKAGETSEVSWHADENGSFQLRLGGTDCETGTVLLSGSYGSQPATEVSEVSAAQLQEGANTLRLCLTDAAGNRGQATASLTKDTLTPTTSITEHPAALVNVANAEFKFSGEDGSGSGIKGFQCRLDSTQEADWSACTSPLTLSGLADGSHKFEVRAIDNAGNADASPATSAWTVDTTAPAVGIDSGPSGLTNDATPTFTFHAGEAGASVVCSIDKGTPSFGPCSTATSHTPESPLADGSWTFRVRSTDEAGNQATATRSFEVDASAPTTAIAEQPAALVNTDEAEFKFSGDDGTGSGVASYECRRDGGAWDPCTSPRTYTELADGSHKFEVRAIDNAGNTDATPAISEWTIDTEAPETQISVHPVSPLNSAVAEFQFTGEDPGGSGVGDFECRRDGGSWASCSSPRSYTGLTEGTHDFEVRATDNAGNVDVSPATFTWTVDLTAPQVAIDSLSRSLLKEGEASEVSWHADEDGTFELRAGGTDCDSGTIVDSGAYSSQPTVHVSAIGADRLQEGANTLRLCVTDAAGNRGQATTGLSVDTEAPETAITAHPAALVGSAAARFEFSGEDPGGSGVASFQCRLDSTAPGDWSACISGKEYTELADGSHTFEARAIDNAGNADQSPATFEWTVDTTPPAVGIDSGPAGLTNDATPTFTFHAGEAGASVECSLDKGTPAFGPCSTAGTNTPEAPLADGSWTFRVRSTDEAGNQATATSPFEVDATAPSVEIAAHPAAPANTAAARFELVGDDGGGSGVTGLECRLDSAEEAAWGSCASGIEYEALSDGSHAFEARATDRAGNTGAPATFTWNIDTEAPETSIGAHPAPLVNSPAAAFEFSGSDPGGSGVDSYQCRLDSEEAGAWAACSSPESLTGLADGGHIFEVRAVDRAGNADATPARFEWTIDTVAPQPTIDSLSKSLLSESETSEVSWHADENGTFELRVGGSDCASGAMIRSGAYSNQPASHASSVSATQLQEGANTLRLCLTDAAGNRGQANATLTLDTTAPETRIDLEPAAFTTSTAAAFAFSGEDPGGSGVASFQCRRDGGTWAGCISPREYTGLAEGAHEFEVKAVDNAGNTDPIPASYAWTVDRTPPAVQIVSGPIDLTNDPTPTFGFGSEPGVTFECSIDQGTSSFEPCAGATTHTPASPLADGTWTFRVRGTDQAGNQATTSRTFDIDSSAPDAPELTATVPASPANDNAPTIYGSATAGATVTLYTGADCSGPAVGTVSPAELEAGIAFPVADDSTTVFHATITIEGRTSGCSEPLIYVEDSTPPQTTISSALPATTLSTSASFFFTASETGVSFECRLDEAPFTTCSSPRSFANLAVGSHSFSVRATDAAGNVETSAAESSWTIEPPPSTPPSACTEGGTEAVTAAAVRSAVEAGEDVCVTADVGDLELRNLGASPVIVSTEGGSIGEIDLVSTTDLTIGRARFRSIEMRHADRTRLLGDTIGGTQANRVPDQLIFMPSESNDVAIEGNDIGWTVSDTSGNTGYGCRCYGDLNRLRFVGNRVHDIAADGFQGVGGTDVVIDRNEIGPVGRNPGSNEHSDNIQITGNDANLRITDNWLHHQGYYEGEITANSGSTYIHGDPEGSLTYENNLIETAQGRTEICGLGTGGEERNDLTVRRNTWVEGGLAFPEFPGFEWDCDSGSGNAIERNIAIDPDGGFKLSGSAGAAAFAANLWGGPGLVTLDAGGNCTSANCNPAGEEPIGYRKPSGVGW